MDESDVSEEMRELAAALSLDTSDAVVESCRESYDDLSYVGEFDDVERPSPVGRRSDDEGNAFLHVYETPRSEREAGPLSGVSLAIKDNVAVEGLPMTCGMRDVSFVPDYDAAVVERLLAAGGEVVGKTNMDGLAIGPDGKFSEFEQVRNPAYPDRVPGGSSSGSASAVASGQADAALGTDTGGSVRIPAAYCGLVGAKSTHGLVPRHGLVPLAPSLDTIGPLARDVTTAAEVLAVMAGHDARDPTSSRVELDSLSGNLDSPPSTVVGVPEPFLDNATPEVREVIEGVADAIDDEPGWSTRAVDLSNDINDVYPHVSGTEFTWLVRQSGVNHGQGPWYDEAWAAAFAALREAGFNEHITERKLPAAYLDAKTNGRSYARAREAMIRFQQEVDELFESVDLLLTPTIPILPPHVEEDPADRVSRGGEHTKPFNLAGTPAVAVPAGEREGLPVSAQVVAPRFEDGRALQGARLVEKVRDSV